MATPNIVPRANNEGSLGTSGRQWGGVHAHTIMQDGKPVANLDSPAMTGTPTAPTQSGSDNSTKLATTAWVTGKLSGLMSLVAGATGKLAVFNSNGMVESSGRSVADILSRANHTGTMPHTAITGLGSLATASSVTRSQISDATENGRMLLGSTYAQMLSAIEAMAAQGIRGSVTANETLDITDSVTGSLITVTNDITVTSSTTVPGVVILVIESGKSVEFDGIAAMWSDGSQVAGDSLGEGVYQVFINGSLCYVLNRPDITSESISDAASVATPSKVVIRDGDGSASFKALTLSGNLILGAASSITTPSGTLSYPSGSGYLARTDNPDGSVIVAMDHVTGLTAALEGKAASDHTHDTYALSSELTSGLAGKADSSHVHSIANISGLQAALDDKLEEDDIASIPMGNIYGLSTALSGKSDSDHNHDADYATITSVNGKADASHTHPLNEITSLVGTLSGLQDADTAMGVRMTTAEGKIATLESKATSLESQVTAVTGIVATRSVGPLSSSESAALFTDTNAANSWSVGKVKEITMMGAIAVTTGEHWTIRLKLNETNQLVCVTPTLASDIPAGTPFRLTVATTCRALAGSNNFAITLLLWIDGVGPCSDFMSVTSTIDTTAQTVFTVTAQCSVSDGNSFLEAYQAWVR